MTPKCPHCQDRECSSDHQIQSVVCFGYFNRKSDQKRLQRFRCNRCTKTFSEGSFSRCYRQKKRLLNAPIFEILCSGVSQRRAARILRTNRKTIVRKFLFLGINAQELLLATNQEHPKAQIVEFDDLETFEHSKCKPLSVIMAVEHKTRRILGYRVARMPAKGPLAAISRKRYGYRRDERPKARKALFQEIKDLAEEGALFKSDMNPSYGPDVVACFPKSRHQVFKGRKGCVVGQGELKRGGFDPLFSLNHSFAMTRANMNRLFRRTWCTTKIPGRLSCHLAIYALYHNLVLVPR